MTALVSMFNFLKVYFDYYVTLFFGGKFETSSHSGEFHKVAYDLIAYHFADIVPYFPEGNWFIEYSGFPILQIGLGIFIFGAIIGLAKRLLRG